MKKFFETSTLMAALTFISLAVSGCGKGNDGNGTGVGTPGNPGVPGYGVTQPLPGGGARIAFTGNNVYNSGVRIYGISNGYQDQTTMGVQPLLTIGSANIPVGQPGTMTGKGFTYPGSTVNLIATPVPGNPLASNIAGAIDLDPAFVMNAFAGGMPAVIAIKIDVYTSGSSIYGGGIYLCTSKDQGGNCHGGFLEI